MSNADIVNKQLHGLLKEELAAELDQEVEEPLDQLADLLTDDDI